MPIYITPKTWLYLASTVLHKARRTEPRESAILLQKATGYLNQAMKTLEDQ